jgi:hypothetical protein
MAKVLVERPRHGGGWRRPGRPARALEDAAPREGMRLRGTKHFNEHLGPLGKYLGRQVGRPWNKVFGEMRAHIKPGNTVQEHILSHIDQFLAIHVDKVAPSPQAPCGVRYQPHTRRSRWGAVDVGMLYVDPDDGLIKRARRRLKGPPPAVAEDSLTPRRLPDGRMAAARGGVWFAANFHPYSVQPGAVGVPSKFVIAGREYDHCWDPTFGHVRPTQNDTLKALARAYGPGVLPADYRQLTRRELGLYGLKNVPAA